MGHHVFGCDICQDVCPWNGKAARNRKQTHTPPWFYSPDLAELSEMTEDDFRRLFRNTPVWRTKYRGFLRNVAIAMGNSEIPELLEPLKRLAEHPDPTVAAAAQASRERLQNIANCK